LRELTVETRLVTVEQIEGAGLIGERAKCERGASGGMDRAGIVLLDLRLKTGAFDGPAAHLTPAGDGHVLYQDALGFGLRRELIGQCVEDFGEGFGLFVVEDHKAR
jgi:hypothetical protein